MIIFNSVTKELLKILHPTANNEQPICLTISQSLTDFTFNERRKLIVAVNQTFHMFHIKREEKKKAITSSNSEIIWAKYNESFNQIVSCTKNEIVVWDIYTGRMTFKFLSGDHMLCASFDSFQRRLFTGNTLGEFRIWNFNTGALLKKIRPFNRIKCEINNIEVCNIDGNENLKRTRNYIVVSNSCHYLSVFEDLSKFSEKSFMILPMGKPEQIKKAHIDASKITGILFVQPNHILTGCDDGKLVLWSLFSGHVIESIDDVKQLPVHLLRSFSRNILVVRNGSNEIEIYDHPQLKLSSVSKIDDCSEDEITFISKEAKTSNTSHPCYKAVVVLVGTYSGKILLLKKTGRMINFGAIHRKKITSCRFLNLSKCTNIPTDSCAWILTASLDKTIKLLRLDKLSNGENNLTLTEIGFFNCSYEWNLAKPVFWGEAENDQQLVQQEETSGHPVKDKKMCNRKHCSEKALKNLIRKENRYNIVLNTSSFSEKRLRIRPD